MASVSVDKLPPAEKEQLAVSYAAFVLEGAGAEITTDSLNAVIKAAGLKAENALVNAMAKALKGKKASSFFGSVGAASAPAAEAPKEEAKKADKKEEKKKEAPPPPPPEEEEDMDMGDLFG